MNKIPIPSKMEKFYGTGTMLHPDKEMIESRIKEIPFGKVVTIDSICERLAREHDTDVTCPMRTTNFVKAISETYANSTESIPFWRVIRKNHQLINTPFTELCAENLQQEGFQMDQNSKGAYRVVNAEEQLFTFS